MSNYRRIGNRHTLLFPPCPSCPRGLGSCKVGHECSTGLQKGSSWHTCIINWPFPSWYLLLVKLSIQFSHSVMSNSLRPHGLQHARLPCPSPTPGARSNSCPLSQWCHWTISSSVVPFSSCLQSFPASGSFPMSQFFASCGQSIGASASVLPMKDLPKL